MMYDSILVETDWLASHLNDPHVRVIDSTVLMQKDEQGNWRPSSGRSPYLAGHIPGAHFVDLFSELNDPKSNLGNALTEPEHFSRAMGALGIDEDTQVVIYATAVAWWATRLWWMLRVYGHQKVAILNGGMKKWQAEGRSLSTDSPAVEAREFTPRFRPELFADQAQVQEAIESGSSQVVNALSPQLFSGESSLGYARRGRIANSVNLSALSLIDPKTGCYLDEAALRLAIDEQLGNEATSTICYCGGGIAATLDAFALTLLGHENVAVYDASIEEWAANPDLPMETG
jgi:thiosulfate/3-mercaptopyruvate sulfurtransferase